VDDARSALVRFVALHPEFAPGWEHLLWVALMQRDSITAARAAEEVNRLGAGVEARRDWLAVLSLRAQLSRTGVIPGVELARSVELVVSAAPLLGENIASGLVADGAPAAQIQLSRAVRQHGVAPVLAVALWRGEALAWAARGAWDSTLIAADRWALADAAAVGPYRLAVAGTLLGALSSDEARSRRPSAAMAVPRGSPDDQADMHWLDGVLAYLQREPQALAAARRALSDYETEYSAFLDRSLTSLATDAAGDRAGAARELVELEREIADHEMLSGIDIRHPLLAIVNRLVAARWLRSLGDDAEAARLLMWHEAMPGPP
jgi:hypothetical protein